MILLASCMECDSDTRVFSSVDANIDENSEQRSLEHAIAGSRKIPDGQYVSFLIPGSNNSLDTLTVLTSKQRLIYLKDSSFYFIGSLCSDDLKAISGDDTMYINYGGLKMMDYIPYQKIPTINKSLLKKVFSLIDREEEYTLSDTVVSSYKLFARGLVDGIEFADATVYPNYMHDPCFDKTVYPEPLKFWKYYLKIEDNIGLPRDTIVDWTLIYIDQYGRRDSLAMTTRFR